MTDEYPIYSPRKLIEVALPLDAINKAAKVEKSVPRRGHPQTLHYWWARRPLAAARAVIFAQMVNDPGFQQGKGFKYGMNKMAAARERQRLFHILEDLVQWENTDNDKVLESARAEIRRSWREVCTLNKNHPQASELFNPDKLPGLHDPFAGGGAIPLEAQRLGLDAYASDLNPVAVLINKAMIEIPPQFMAEAAVNPKSQNDQSLVTKEWRGTSGLAEDVRYYGQWIQDEIEKRIGHLYPMVKVTPNMVQQRSDLDRYEGNTLIVLAWLWARTMKSPNPAFAHIDVPLASTFLLSGNKGNQSYIHPVIEGDNYRFEVKVGIPPEEAKKGTKVGRGNFRCLMSGAPISVQSIRAAGQSGQLGFRLMAILAKGDCGRVYLPPPATGAECTLGQEAGGSFKLLLQGKVAVNVPLYGMKTFADLYAPRQLVTLTTLADLIGEVRDKIEADAMASGLTGNIDSTEGCERARAYSSALALYLSFALSRTARYNNAHCIWNIRGAALHRFSRGRRFQCLGISSKSIP